MTIAHPLYPHPIDKPSEPVERLLQERFRKLGRFPEAFSSIQYRGTRTYNPPTDFSGLLRSVEQQLDNNTTRSPRSPRVVFKALQVGTRTSLCVCMWIGVCECVSPCVDKCTVQFISIWTVLEFLLFWLMHIGFQMTIFNIPNSIFGKPIVCLCLCL